jgi:hypothetical protein
MVSCSIGETMDQILDKSTACNNFYRIDQVFGSLQELVFPVPKKEHKRILVTEWKQGCSDKTTRKERKTRRAQKQKCNQTKDEESRLARLTLIHNMTQEKVKQPTRKRTRAPFPENNNSSLRVKAQLSPIPEVEEGKENRNGDSVDAPVFKIMVKKVVFLGNELIKKVQFSPIPENAESKENRDDDRHLDMADPALNDLTFIPSTEDDDMTYALKVGSDNPLIAGFLEDIETDNYKPEEVAPLAKAE